jgi:Na+-driven multidrug efflux pump
MRVFIADAGVIEEGILFLRIVAFAWSFFGGLMVLQGAFRGAGYTKHAMVLSLLSRWVFRIPVMALLAYPLGFGPAGLWWGWALTSVAAFVVGAVWFNRGSWKAGVLEADEPGPGPPGDEAFVDPAGDSEPTD